MPRHVYEGRWQSRGSWCHFGILLSRQPLRSEISACLVSTLRLQKRQNQTASEQQQHQPWLWTAVSSFGCKTRKFSERFGQSWQASVLQRRKISRRELRGSQDKMAYCHSAGWSRNPNRSLAFHHQSTPNHLRSAAVLRDKASLASTRICKCGGGHKWKPPQGSARIEIGTWPMRPERGRSKKSFLSLSIFLHHCALRSVEKHARDALLQRCSRRSRLEDEERSCVALSHRSCCPKRLHHLPG